MTTRLTTACTGFVGVCAVYKHFSGFWLILLPSSYPACPQTSNANRSADALIKLLTSEEVSLKIILELNIEQDRSVCGPRFDE